MPSIGPCGSGRHGDRPVRLGEVQPPGKRPMPAADWARGARPGPASGSADAGRTSGARPGRRAPGPRRPALTTLLRARRRPSDAYANLVLPALLRERGLDGRDAALRDRARLRHAARGRAPSTRSSPACADRPLAEIDPAVLDVLRLGRLPAAATSGPAHAAVATTVDLARAASATGAAGFVNAVLRRVARRRPRASGSAELGGDAGDAAGARYRHPAGSSRRSRDALGGDAGELEAALVADDAAPETHLVARPDRRDEALAEQAGGEPGP